MKLSTLLLVVISNFLVFTIPGGYSALQTAHIIDYATRQYAILSERVLGETRFISTGDPLQPTWSPLKDLGDWTVGFHGGSLWMLYKLTQAQ